MSTYPTSFDTATMQPDPASLSETGREAIAKLAERGYHVTVGLTADIVPKLHELSLQHSIKEYCPNDCTKRFADVPTAEHWLEKGRVTVLLVETATGDIAGYGWFGDGTSPHVPEGKETFALRISESHQGKGLATPYAQALLDIAEQLYGVEHLWLEAWESNAGAVHIYQKLGFTLVDQETSERPTADGGTVQDTRLYMK